MTNIQFKGGQVLFRGDKVSFCATDCTCTDPGGSDPPDPNTTTCGACKSTSPCSAYNTRDCTPSRLKLTLTDPTFQTSCLACSVDLKSIKVVSGSIAGDKTLTQDPTHACRWVLVDTAPSLTVGGFDSTDCTSTQTNAATVTYTVEQGLDNYTILVTASFTSIKGSEFTLFSATVPGLLDSPGSGTVAGDSGFSFECFDYTERGGGRLGQGGTAVLSLCPAVPRPCNCDDTPTCIQLPGVIIPIDLPAFTYDATVTTTLVTLLRTDVCTWASGTVSAAGVTNLQADLIQRAESDPDATQGCGYYLTLSAWDGTNAIPQVTYFLEALTSAGYYRVFDNIEDGFPSGLTVETTCTLGTPSPNCTSTKTPKSWQVGFSSLATSVVKDAGECGYGSMVHGAGTPATTYPLTQNLTNPSLWEYFGTGPGLYVDGILKTSNYIALTATGSGFSLTMSVLDTGAVTDPTWFTDDGSNVSTDCAAPQSFTNLNTTYSCSEIGIGGTAYAVPKFNA